MRTKLILGLFGLIGFSELYIWEPFRAIPALFSDFAIILSAIAFILGGINIIQVNWNVKKNIGNSKFFYLKLVSFVMSVVAHCYGIRCYALDHGTNNPRKYPESNDVISDVFMQDRKDAIE